MHAGTWGEQSLTARRGVLPYLQLPLIVMSQGASPGADCNALSQEGHVSDAIGVEGYGCGRDRSGRVRQQACNEDQHAKGPGLGHLQKSQIQ